MQASYVIQPECMRALTKHLVTGLFGPLFAASLGFVIADAGVDGPLAGLVASTVQSLIGFSVSTGTMLDLLDDTGMTDSNTALKVTGPSASLACRLCQALGHHSGAACPK